MGIAFPGGIRALKNGLLSIDDQSANQTNGSVDIFNTSNMAGGPISTITGFADPESGSWGRLDVGTWQADMVSLRVDYAKPAASPQVRFSIGYGLLSGPADAFVFPAGNK